MLGFLAVAFLPIPFLFYIYGERLRQNSKYAPTDLGKNGNTDDEESRGQDDEGKSSNDEEEQEEKREEEIEDDDETMV